MADYVVGFLFSSDMSKLVLMQKKRPDWQVGMLNGPGGRVRTEDDESPYQAMEREFKEETGASGILWRPFCQLQHGENKIIFFTGRADVEVKTMTDERVRWYCLRNEGDIVAENIVPNGMWLVPMAQDPAGVTASVVDPS